MSALGLFVQNIVQNPPPPSSLLALIAPELIISCCLLPHRIYVPNKLPHTHSYSRSLTHTWWLWLVQIRAIKKSGQRCPYRVCLHIAGKILCTQCQCRRWGLLPLTHMHTHTHEHTSTYKYITAAIVNLQKFCNVVWRGEANSGGVSPHSCLIR